MSENFGNHRRAFVFNCGDDLQSASAVAVVLSRARTRPRLVYVELLIAILWVTMRVVLLRQHFIMRTGFLNRVAAAFVIGGTAEE